MLTSDVLDQLPAELLPESSPTRLLTRPGGLMTHRWTLASVLDQAVLMELPIAAAWLDQPTQLPSSPAGGTADSTTYVRSDRLRFYTQSAPHKRAHDSAAWLGRGVGTTRMLQCRIPGRRRLVPEATGDHGPTH